MPVNEWISFQPGIRYYTHESRMRSRYSKEIDRMFGFKFMFRGKRYTCNLGWESEGMTEDRVLELWTKYAKNRTLNTPPFSPTEEIEIQEQQREINRQNTFANVFEDCMRVKAVSVTPLRLQKMKGLYDIWVGQVIGHIPIGDLKPVHIAQVLANLQAGTPPVADVKTYKKGPRSPQTQKHVFNLIRLVWNYAIDCDIVNAKFPGRKITIVFDNERQFFFSREQAITVLNDLRNGQALKGEGGARGSIDAWGMALLSLQCGLRAGEILSLKWSDVKEQTIYETKNKKKSRRFYTTPEVKNMLEERKRLSLFTKETDYVFPTEQGGKLVQIGRIFDRCFLRLGINKAEETSSAKKAVFHSFRHTYATWLAQKGTPMVILAALLGHSVLKTTERYIKYSPKNVEEIAASAIESLDQIIL